MKITKEGADKQCTFIFVTVGSKKFIRVTNYKATQTFQWRNAKTNSPCNKKRSGWLEREYDKIRPLGSNNLTDLVRQRIRTFDSLQNKEQLKTPPPPRGYFNGKKTEKELHLDKEVLEEYKTTKSKLSAVKLFNDRTSLGLKYSKDYVFELIEKSEELEKLLSDVQSLHKDKSIEEMNKDFNRNSEKKNFIAEVMKVYRDKGQIAAMAFMRSKTDWSGFSTKLFFDKYIDKKIYQKQ